MVSDGSYLTVLLDPTCVTLSASDVSDNLTDEQRIEWIAALVEGCQKDSTIAIIRDLANNPSLND
jgi:hypothetical protein